jgi:hypothetical protein
MTRPLICADYSRRGGDLQAGLGKWRRPQGGRRWGRRRDDQPGRRWAFRTSCGKRCFPEFRWRRPQGGGGGRRLCRSAREEVGLSYAVWKADAFRNFGGDDPREEEGVVAVADQPGRRWAFRTSCGKRVLSGKKVRRRQGGGEAPSLLPWALREEVQDRTRNLICRKPPRGRFRRSGCGQSQDRPARAATGRSTRGQSGYRWHGGTSRL